MKEVLLAGLKPGQNYVVQVRAVSNNRQSAWSPALSFTTIIDNVAPARPNPDTTAFRPVGRDFAVDWEAPTLNEDGTVLQDLKDFQLTFYPTGQRERRRSYYNNSTSHTFSYVANVSAWGQPEPKVTVEIRSRDFVGNLSQPTIKEAINLPPGDFVLEAQGQERATKLTWTMPSGDDIKHFDIIRDGIVVGNTTDTEYIDNEPGAGVKLYTVRATDWYNQTNNSNTVEARATGYFHDDLTIPKPPANVAVSTGLSTNNALGSTAFITVAWDAPIENTDDTDYEDHEGFRVRWSSEGWAGPYHYMTVADDRTSGTSGKRFNARIDALESGKRYWVSVQAYDRYSMGSEWAFVGTGYIDTKVDTTPPPQMDETKFSVNGGIESIFASWSNADEPDDFARYEIYASTGEVTVTEENLKYAGTGTSASWRASGGERWNVTARMVDKAGNQGPLTATKYGIAIGGGDPVNDTTAPDWTDEQIVLTPSLYSQGGVTYGRIHMSWEAPDIDSSDLSGYYLRLREASGDWIIVTVDKSQQFYVFSGLPANDVSVTYQAQLAAFDKVGNVSDFRPADPAEIQLAGVGAPTESVTMQPPDIKPHMITYRWSDMSAVNNFNDYHVEIYADFIGDSPVRVYYTDTNWLAFSAGTAGTRYFARVRIRNIFGQFSEWNTPDFNDSAVLQQTTSGDIQSVDANKITAGSGIINNLDVKASLTVNSAGSIRSSNFNDTDGYQLTHNELLMRRGQISLGGSSSGFFANDVGQIWSGAPTFSDSRFRVNIDGAVRVGSSTGLHINSTGSIWSGAVTRSSAPWYISEQGEAFFKHIHISGEAVSPNEDLMNLDNKFILHKHSDGNWEFHVAADFSLDANANMIVAGGNITMTSGNFNMNGGDFRFSGGNVLFNGADVTMTSGTFRLAGSNWIQSGGKIIGVQPTGYTSYVLDAASGITVHKGSISGSALRIQDNPNLVPYAYSAFTYPTDWYAGRVRATHTAISWAISTLRSRYYEKSLTVYNSGTAMHWVALSESNEYNIKVIPGLTYYVSGWVMNNSSVNVDVRFVRQDATGAVYIGSGKTLAPQSGWQRIVETFTTGSTMTEFGLGLSSGPGVVYWDGIQVEERGVNSDRPSDFKIGGITTIHGGMIQTGQIQSNNWATGQANRWRIDLNGNADFHNVNLTGGIFASGDIRGSVITASTFQTATAGTRLTIDQSNKERIKFIDSNNAVRGYIGVASNINAGILSIHSDNMIQFLNTANNGFASVLGRNLELHTGAGTEAALFINNPHSSTGSFNRWLWFRGGSSNQAEFSMKYVESPHHVLMASKTAGLKLLNTSAGVQVRTGADDDYAPIQASSFIVMENTASFSTQNVQDAEPVTEEVENTPVRQWMEQDKRHTFPMTERLPEELITRSERGEAMVDLRDIVGMLWKANQELLARVKRLEARGLGRLTDS